MGLWVWVLGRLGTPCESSHFSASHLSASHFLLPAASGHCIYGTIRVPIVFASQCLTNQKDVKHVQREKTLS